jgi:hypothetical protein
MKNKNTIKFILILAVFFGASVSAIGIMAMDAGAVSFLTEIPDAIYPAVNLISLDADETIAKSVEQLDAFLSPYIEVDTTTITDMQILDDYLDDNSDNYMVLFGHSNEVGMKVSNQLVSWGDLSSIVTQNKEQIVIIPTCNSMNLYDANPQAIQNVLSPFENEIDYRISVDFTSLAIGLLLQNEELVKIAANQLGNDCAYLVYPEETLIIPQTQSGSFRTPGAGRIEVTDVMAEWLLANSFIIGGSVGTAITQGLLKLIGRGGIPISFIIQIFCVYNNFVHTQWFFLTHLGLITADYVIDRYTDVTWQCTFSELGYGRFIFYGRTIATAKYTFYSAQYVVKDITRQDYYHVTLTVDTHVLDTLVLYDLFSFGILTTALTTWSCTGSGTLYIGGGGGGGTDLPF